MTFFTPLQQRLSACLAILAVLLLFVAPVVSKDLMARHGDAMAAPVMAMSHSADAMPMMHHMDDAMMPSGHMMSGEEGVACGYCELLVHVPLMIWAAVPLLWLMMLISRAPPSMLRADPPLCRRERRVYRPRAPPSRCVF
ncbi:MAG TPA: DUF2946 domain-containing protein [Pantoea sp.]|nr:DUF2946 domain-containing protein [Pantoea sp.]